MLSTSTVRPLLHPSLVPVQNVVESSTPPKPDVIEKQFYADIPEEQQRLWDLKYTIYITIHEDQCRAEIRNQNCKKFSLQTPLDSSSIQRSYLVAYIQCLQTIFQAHTQEEKQYIGIELMCPDVYLVNIVREWFVKWIQELATKPNSDLLQQLLPFYAYSRSYEAKWIPADHPQLKQMISG